MSNRVRNTLLVISIALNLLAVGGAVGFLARGGGGHGSPPNLDRMVKQLDESARQKLRPLLREHNQVMRPLRREMLQDQRALTEAILIEPFDEDQVRQALSNLHEHSSQLQNRMHEQLLLLLGQMSLEERQQAVRTMHRHGRRRKNDAETQQTPPG